MKAKLVYKGGAGSGDFGHEGQTGHYGGSLPKDQRGSGGGNREQTEGDIERARKREDEQRQEQREDEKKASDLFAKMEELARGRDAAGFMRAARELTSLNVPKDIKEKYKKKALKLTDMMSAGHLDWYFSGRDWLEEG